MTELRSQSRVNINRGLAKAFIDIASGPSLPASVAHILSIAPWVTQQQHCDLASSGAANSGSAAQS
jgi:hypothetical protein